MPVGRGTVAALQHHVNHLAQRFDERQEGVEQALGGHGRGQHRQPHPGAAVAEHLDAVALPRAHGQPGAGPDGVRQGEGAVGVDG